MSTLDHIVDKSNIDSSNSVASKSATKSSDILYFDYGKKPQLVPIDDYMKVYDAFCKAYNITVTDYDINRFKTEIYLKIFKKRVPEGVDYRPRASRARLYVTPQQKRIRFHSHSYDSKNGLESRKFMDIANKYLHFSRT